MRSHNKLFYHKSLPYGILLSMENEAVQNYLASLPEKALAFGVRLVIAVILLLLCWKLINVIVKLTRKAMAKAGVDQGVIHFIASFLGTGLKIMLLIAIAAGFGVNTAGVIALFGSAGVAIGLAVQGSLSNLAGGIMILLLKPFRVGDYICEDTHGHEGTVKEISLFNTKLSTYDNKVVVLPNGDLANTSLTNFTGATMRMLEIKIGVSYDADIARVKEVLTRLIRENEAVFQEEPVSVFLDSFADSAIIMGLRCFVPVTDFKKRLWDMNEKIKYAFDEAQIVIPFPQQDVHLKRD